MEKEADVCLFLEGTYPYVQGGVSSWVHELIREQSHLTFHIVTLLAPNAEREMKYDVPDNVVQIDDIFLQVMGEKSKKIKPSLIKGLFDEIEEPLQLFQDKKGGVDDFKKILDAFERLKSKLSSRQNINADVLLNSEEAWKFLHRVYAKHMSETSFIDYFWSWRALLGGFYSVILTPLPKAKCYHALCTGYAGLFLARAGLETGKKCAITEHGIYTNERRIELASADWLVDQKSYSLNVQNADVRSKELRDFWTNTFVIYSKLCYATCDKIITLYRGNQDFQLVDGADPARMEVIPNGIDFEKFSVFKRKPNRPPTIALIGRVVPIKDVKTYIRACGILKEAVPELCAYMMGPTDEDKEYYNECVEMVEYLGLEETVIFTGRVNILEYMDSIDVMVLTSISEAQPLVILEVGASGIPSVTTNVGSCSEIIYGMEDEEPALGAGGAVTSLSNPKAIATEILKLLGNRELYNDCSLAIKQRVEKYYNKVDQHSAYRSVYDDLMKD